jgi:hypothetical protein
MPLKDMLPVLVKLNFLNIKMLKEALPLIKQYNKDVEDVLYKLYNNKILFDTLVSYNRFY